MDDYKLFDADNHYYEPEDAFTRHGDDEVKRFVRWVTEGKRKYILFGGKQPLGIPNPTFNPIAKPGAFHARLKELADGGVRGLPFGDKRIFGELEPLPDCYLNRDSRLKVMDEQGVERALFFPTMGVGVEGLNPDRITLNYKLFHAFNLWLDEDWGFDYKNRIYAAPHIPVGDPILAAKELDFLLERGAKLVSMRPGPANGRSPADPSWDPFWARVNESGVIVAYHGFPPPDDYSQAFQQMWQRHGVGDLDYESNLGTAIAGQRAIEDTALALVLGNLFGRFPNVRIFAVELGMAWVYAALHAMDHAGGIAERSITAFGETILDRPSDIFKEHFWISPFPEEEVTFLIEQVGIDHVVFGSDWPHAEGTVQPRDYLTYLDKLTPEDERKIMHDNAMHLLRL